MSAYTSGCSNQVKWLVAKPVVVGFTATRRNNGHGKNFPGAVSSGVPRCDWLRIPCINCFRRSRAS
jgi:hypothetical protein